MAGNLAFGSKCRQRLHHRLRAAAHEVLRHLRGGKYLRHVAVETLAAIVRRQMDGDIGSAKVFHARQEVRGTSPIKKTHPLDRAGSRLARKAAGAEQFARIGQKGSLANPPRHQADVVEALQRGEAIAQRAPDVHLIAGRSSASAPVTLPTTR